MSNLYHKLKLELANANKRVLDYDRSQLFAAARRLEVPVNRNQTNMSIRNMLINKLHAIARKNMLSLREPEPEPVNQDVDVDQLLKGIFSPPKQQIEDEMPTTGYPYFAQTTRHYEHGPIRDRRATLITDANKRAKFIKHIDDAEVDSPILPAALGRVTNTYTANRHPVSSVAKVNHRHCGKVMYEVGNCVLNILKQAEVDVGKVYMPRYLPHLKPDQANPRQIYITHDEIKRLTSILKLSIHTYTALGAKLNKIWHSFKCKRGKSIHIQCSDGHATLLPGKIEATKINYVDHVDIPLTPDVVDYGYFQLPRTASQYDSAQPMFYVTIAPGKEYTLHKTFRPSSVTLNPDDDKPGALNYVFTPEQMLFRMFKQAYNLAPINNKDIHAVVKTGEHFIKRRIFNTPTSAMRLVDHNKNYMSYKLLPEYIGFPTHKLMTAATINCISQTPLFVICVNVTNYPESFRHFYEYSSGPITLQWPVYQYLISVGVHVDVDYYLVGDAQDIDIIGFTDTLLKDGRITSANVKLFRNQMVGRTIAGGLAETKKVTVVYGDNAECEQILHECVEEGLQPDINHKEKTITVNYKGSSNALFHFHSYILGYASIHMMRKWGELENNGCVIEGFNVDAIMYSGNYDAAKSPDLLGGWKTEAVKSYYNTLHVSERDVVYPVRTPPPRPFISNNPITRNTLILAPPGLSKTYGFKTNPLFDQIILTPTKDLRNDIRTGDAPFTNTHTMHKYVQFSCSMSRWRSLRKSGNIPREHYSLVVDECTDYNSKQWDTILERTNGSIIVAIGDFEQLCNSINASPVSIDYFKSKGFDIIYKTREPGAIARHSYEDGVILDSLRGQPDQAKLLSAYVDCVADIDISSMIRGEGDYDIFVCETHRQCNRANLMAKEYCLANNIPLPVKNRDGKVQYISADDHNIWWGRLRMLDEIPKHMLYEPAVAITPDSIHGKTYFANRVYVDAQMTRHGAFYTSVTRTTKLCNTILVGINKPRPLTQADKDAIMAECQRIESYPEALPRSPLLVPNGPTYAGNEYKTLAEVPQGAFVIHTEYPYRHFIGFHSREHFYSWSKTRPTSERCYHEVVDTTERKYVIDVDAVDIPVSDYDAIRKRFMWAFLDCMNAFINSDSEFTLSDIACIDASGFSIAKECNKFSLQIRTTEVMGSVDNCITFAESVAAVAGEYGKYIDMQVYKHIQNFRVIGSTKLGDNRHSRIINSRTVGPHDCWVGYAQDAYVPDTLLPRRIKRSIEVVDIQDGLTERIIIEAAPYTQGLTYRLYNGRHTFFRSHTSHCVICDRDHSADNMFITTAIVGSTCTVSLRCYRSPSGKINLFTFDRGE